MRACSWRAMLPTTWSSSPSTARNPGGAGGHALQTVLVYAPCTPEQLDWMRMKEVQTLLIDLTATMMPVRLPADGRVGRHRCTGGQDAVQAACLPGGRLVPADPGQEPARAPQLHAGEQCKASLGDECACSQLQDVCHHSVNSTSILETAAPARECCCFADPAALPP